MTARRFPNLVERILSKVYVMPWQNENGCHLFGGRLDKDGYGRLNMRIDGKHVTKRAHQVLWEEANGPLPPDHTLDHLDCIAKACCNLDHLECVTRGENSRRRWERARA
jgi:hypothetical protein